MKKRWTQRRDDRGASLIAVLVTIAVVGIMGTVISQLTIANLQLKETERQSKKNFYDAEQVMDDLVVGLNTIASGAMEEAYTNMLSKYNQVTSGGGDIKATFSRLYLDNLEESFTTQDAALKDSTQKKMADDGKVTYKLGYYSLGTVRDAFTDDTLEDRLITTAVDGSADSVAFFHADYEAQTFILDNIIISVPDEQGNVTTIKTDMVFHTPDLNFDGSNLVKEFMRYSLIADRDIQVDSRGVNVDGNVYAGSRGIFTSGLSSAEFRGNKIVTRGDIKVVSQGKLTLGVEDDKTQVWAENIVTEQAIDNSDVSPILNINGSIYVSDDLEINGKNDQVELKGEYFGYNFLKAYDGSTNDMGAEYSSAIAINGQNSRLNLTGLKRLWIAGRTYIGRTSGGSTSSQDIMLGESMTVRSSQVAYFVPDNCLDNDPDNPGKKVFNHEKFEVYCGVPDIETYLSSDKIAKYYYVLNGATMSAYYLDFASEQKANDFYAAYYSVQGTKVNTYASTYLADEALVLDDANTILTLRGDILYRDGTELKEKRAVISGDKWGASKIYYNFSADLAMKYSSLQRTLTDSNKYDADKVRLEKHPDTGVDEPDEPQMFNTLIDNEAFYQLVPNPGDKKEIKMNITESVTDPVTGEVTDGITKQKLVAIVNGGYTVSNDYTGGIVVASGDVRVEASDFAGTIISGGEITFAENASVKSDEVVVAGLLAQNVKDPDPDVNFASIFKGYVEDKNGVMGEASIDRYLTYDNWTKTIE